MGTNQFNIKVTGTNNNTWKGYLDFGRSIWTATYPSTGTALGITTTNNTKTISRGNLTTGTLGQYAFSGTRANRSFHITIDAQQIIDHPERTASVAYWAKFVGMHEMGHALSLIDNPPTTRASVMKYRPMSVSPPQSTLSYDRECVAAIY